MNNKILQREIKLMIADNESLYVKNWVATKHFEELTEPTSQDRTNYDAAKFNMAKAEENVAWLKKLLKTE